MNIMLVSTSDICYSINFFTRYQYCFTEQLSIQLKNVLRYLKATQNFVLFYNK